jgi:hypothetical protein
MRFSREQKEVMMTVSFSLSCWEVGIVLGRRKDDWRESRLGTGSGEYEEFCLGTLSLICLSKL